MYVGGDKNERDGITLINEMFCSRCPSANRLSCEIKPDGTYYSMCAKHRTANKAKVARFRQLSEKPECKDLILYAGGKSPQDLLQETTRSEVKFNEKHEIDKTRFNEEHITTREKESTTFPDGTIKTKSNEREEKRNNSIKNVDTKSSSFSCITETI